MRAQLADGRPVAGKTGHDRELRRRVVRRLHAAARGLGLGRLPEPAAADDERVRRHSRSPAARIPALIFKTFMEQALTYLNDAAARLSRRRRSRRPSRRASSSANGVWQRDNGQCKGHDLARSSSAARGRHGSRTASRTRSRCRTCSGESFDDATARLSTQPLRTQAIYKPASPGQRVGVVVGEIPRIGTYLRSLATVRLVLAKPLHGVVPNVVGLSSADGARAPRRPGPEAGRGRAAGRRRRDRSA